MNAATPTADTRPSTGDLPAAPQATNQATALTRELEQLDTTNQKELS